jgi:hypothetical protein
MGSDCPVRIQSSQLQRKFDIIYHRILEKYSRHAKMQPVRKRAGNRYHYLIMCSKYRKERAELARMLRGRERQMNSLLGNPASLQLHSCRKTIPPHLHGTLTPDRRELKPDNRRLVGLHGPITAAIK